MTDILNSSGAVVVTYVYDAWGRIRSKSGSLIDTLGFDNPLRYRGYVCDVQTEFYYLQSRYYYPIWGRFLNADAFSSTGQGFAGNNMFAYCNNNPVNCKDPSGKIATAAIVGLGLLFVGIVAGFAADDSETIQHQYETELSNAKAVYNKNTVNINGDLNESKSLVNVTINPNNIKNGKIDPNIHIENSYKITSQAEREAILDVIVESAQFDATVFTRGKNAWMSEWAGHNFIYYVLYLTPLRDNAQHVDLNEMEELPWDLFW